MKINFNVKGQDRKNLVAAIAELLEAKAKYEGMPSAAYTIGGFTVTKNGELIGEDNELLLERLAERGFEAEIEAPKEEAPGVKESQPVAQESPQVPEEGKTTVAVPLDGFGETELENLKRLIKQKEGLMKRAFKAESIEIEVDEERISFPWFPEVEDADELSAYSWFVAKFAEHAKNHRVSDKEKEIVNEKYEFRCFLLRLGFIGDEFKKQRKVLLRNLSGSAAFKSGARKGGEKA